MMIHKNSIDFELVFIVEFEIWAFSQGTGVKVVKQGDSGYIASYIFLFSPPGTFSIRGVIKSRVSRHWCALATIMKNCEK